MIKTSNFSKYLNADARYYGSYWLTPGAAQRFELRIFSLNRP